MPNTHNGFYIRELHHNTPEGILNEIENNIEIRINGEVVDKNEFFSPSHSAIKDTFSESSSNSNDVVDPAAFFGSSMSGLLNSVKKI